MRDTRSVDNIAWIISRNEDRWSKELAGVVVASVLRVLVGGNCAPGLAGFNVVLPWPSSLSFPFPFYHRSLIPDRKVTAAPVAFHPHFLLPAPLLPPFSPISTFVVPAWDLSLAHYLPALYAPMYVAVHSVEWLSTLFHCVSPPSPATLLKVYKAVTPSSHQRERRSNRLRYRDLEWNRGSVTVTIYSYHIRIALG